MAKRIRVKVPTSAFFFALIFYVICLYFLKEKEQVTLPVGDLPICLYSNQAGDNLRATFTQAILSAKESIVCLIYSLTDEEIIAALRQQAEKGVKVLVLHDPVATCDVQHKLGPKVELVGRRTKGLMHNKLLSIDHQIAWIGSANFTRDSLLLHANLVMGIASPILAQSIEEKAENLRRKEPRRFTPLSIRTDRQELQLSYLPDDGLALEKLLLLLETAKKSIKVAMFTFTHPKLTEALIDAHTRGVDVEVVFDRDSSRKTSKMAMQRLTRAKMKVFVSERNGLLHEKVAIIDDTTLIMGSANWTKAAFGANDENILWLSPLTPQQQEKLRQFWRTTLLESQECPSGRQKM